MSIFAKKIDSEQGSRGDAGLAGRGFGIDEAIQLLRSLPVDQNAELIVRVVRTTLESLNVHLPDIIEDANRKQRATQERIASVHIQIADLEKRLEGHRQELAALDAELKETTTVKERLQMAEKSAGLSSRGEPSHTPAYGQHPPPPPPGAARAVTKLPDPGETAGHKE